MAGSAQTAADPLHDVYVNYFTDISNNDNLDAYRLYEYKRCNDYIQKNKKGPWICRARFFQPLMGWVFGAGWVLAAGAEPVAEPGVEPWAGVGVAISSPGVVEGVVDERRGGWEGTPNL